MESKDEVIQWLLDKYYDDEDDAEYVADCLIRGDMDKLAKSYADGADDGTTDAKNLMEQYQSKFVVQDEEVVKPPRPKKPKPDPVDDVASKKGTRVVKNKNDSTPDDDSKDEEVEPEVLADSKAINPKKKERQERPPAEKPVTTKLDKIDVIPMMPKRSLSSAIGTEQAQVLKLLIDSAPNGFEGFDENDPDGPGLKLDDYRGKLLALMVREDCVVIKDAVTRTPKGRLRWGTRALPGAKAQAIYDDYCDRHPVAK